MKRTLILFAVLANLTMCFKLSAQNADEIIYNVYQSPNNYVAASFVIDTGTSQSNKDRAFLIWANNLQKDSLKRYFSLSEYDPNLNFLSEQGSTAEKLGSVKNMFPKKIIKSKFAHVYYMLAYTTNSNHTISGLKVYSSPVVYKIDGNNLSLIWSAKINLAVNPNNLNTVIEYNDIIETSDKNIVLVGKYAANTQAQEYALATKLKGSSGAIMWRYKYNAGEQCNEAANTITETSDKKLSVAGYVKKCSSGFNGISDMFYMELQSSGIPVAGVYRRYLWGSNLNLWADKITCYTASAGNDQLIISGYVDLQSVNGAIDRQILVMNVRQNGTIVTMHHIGDIKNDVCNDLIVTRNGSLQNDYLIYLTGQTSNYNSQASVSGEAYFLFAKFNSSAGVTGISEMSTFPVTTKPYNSYRSRNGVEIKNAGDYKKFAILATGVYQPTSTTTGTYSNVLIRDLSDADNCIKRQLPPLKQFIVDAKQATVAYDAPALKIYKEKWIKLGRLTVNELCQEIKIDPKDALNFAKKDIKVDEQKSLLHVSPNPAGSIINVSMIDGSFITNSKQAVIRIYNNAMQLEKAISVNAFSNKINIPVANLKPGIYMLQLVRGDASFGATFIKE